MNKEEAKKIWDASFSEIRAEVPDMIASTDKLMSLKGLAMQGFGLRKLDWLGERVAELDDIPDAQGRNDLGELVIEALIQTDAMLYSTLIRTATDGSREQNAALVKVIFEKLIRYTLNLMVEAEREEKKRQ